MISMIRNEKVDKGNYCLIINVTKDGTIKVGSKGFIDFHRGYYVYVGSALNSLSKRIKRHISSDKKKHWHVDYLLLDKNTKIEEVIYTHCTNKIECEVSLYINKKVDNYIESFGCSDCDCKSHLYYFDSFDEALKVSVDSYKNIGYKPYKWFN
ncbi:MAG: GIY-YIG nuclease family protein [Methanosphaera sp.]|nr:GIY-YIG nuclease family protein [Methanosphaera sp.]